VGSGTNDIATAPDPTSTWTGRSTFFTGGGQGVCFAPALSLFLALGTEPSNTIASAPAAGTSWTGLGQVAFGATGSARGCAFGGNNSFVITGTKGTSFTNQFSTSADGVTFQPSVSLPFSATGGIDVTYAIPLNMFIGVGVAGTNTIAYSTDNGVTWTGLGNSTFTVQGNCVAARYQIINTTTKKRDYAKKYAQSSFHSIFTKIKKIFF
jgi:hypothetical protein